MVRGRSFSFVFECDEDNIHIQWQGPGRGVTPHLPTFEMAFSFLNHPASSAAGLRPLQINAEFLGTMIIDIRIFPKYKLIFKDFNEFILYISANKNVHCTISQAVGSALIGLIFESQYVHARKILQNALS